MKDCCSLLENSSDIEGNIVHLSLLPSVFDDDPGMPNTTNLYIGCINPKVCGGMRICF